MAEEAAEAVRVFQEIGEERGAALAGSVLAYTYCADGRLGAGVEASMRALEEALESGDLRTAWVAYAIVRGYLFPSPYPVADSIRYLEQIHTRLPGSSLERDAERALYLSLTGDFEQARRLVAAVRATSEEHGLALAQMDAAGFASLIEWLAGDLVRAGEEAERALGIGAEIDEALQERAQAAVQLAQIQLELGQLDRAQALIDEYGEHTPEGWFRIPMLTVHAVLLAERGDLAAALELAEAAVRAALATDSPTLQGQAFVARAQVLAASSRPADAQQDLAHGVRLFERKGAVAWAAKVRALGLPLATGTVAR
jgi:tetratricopeptide (TPR) repeat protein